MYKNIFFFLLIKYLKSNTNAIILIDLNLNLNKLWKKKIISLFLVLKNSLEKSILFNNKKGNWLTSLDFALNITKTGKLGTLNYNLNSSIITLNNNKLNPLNTERLFTYYYSLYISFFKLITTKNRYFLSNLFFFIGKKKGVGLSLLNFFVLKKNFFKISYLIINILYLNYNPYIVTHKIFDNTLRKLNIYLQLNNSFLKYGFIFCTSPYVQLKRVFGAKKKNIPLIAIADLNTNTKWIDYPLIIDKSTQTNSFFFLCYILNIFFSLLMFKKKRYKNLYKNYKNINYLKEFIFKNEYNITKNVIWQLTIPWIYLYF